MLLRRFNMKGVYCLVTAAVGFLFLLDGIDAMNCQWCPSMTISPCGQAETGCLSIASSACYTGALRNNVHRPPELMGDLAGVVPCCTPEICKADSIPCSAQCVDNRPPDCICHRPSGDYIDCYDCSDNGNGRGNGNSCNRCSITVNLTEICSALSRCNATTPNHMTTASAIDVNDTSGPTITPSAPTSATASVTDTTASPTVGITNSTLPLSSSPSDTSAAHHTTASTIEGQSTLTDLETTTNSRITEQVSGANTGNPDNGSENLSIIVTVIVAGVIVVVVVLIAIFLLRRRGVLCAGEPEEDNTRRSTEVSTSRSKNRYSEIPSTYSDLHNSGMSSSNGSTGPPGFPGKAESGMENSSDGAKNSAVFLTLEPESSRVVPSAPVYFTVRADSTSGLPGNAPRDNSAASNVADEDNADNVYHEINDRDVRPEDTDDEYNKLGEKKTTKTESGAIYGHLESGDVDYDHVTKGKKSDVRVRHNDYDVAPAARVDSGDYNHVTRDVRSGVTVVGSDYDVAQPRKQSVSQDEGDYDHPPHPKKVKDAKRNGAPTGSAQKGADGEGSYELAGPLSPTTPGAGEASMAVTAGGLGSEGQPQEPDVEANDPKPCGSPYDMASAVV